MNEFLLQLESFEPLNTSILISVIRTRVYDYGNRKYPGIRK